jgi:hypothetical protein
VLTGRSGRLITGSSHSVVIVSLFVDVCGQP